MYLLVYLYKFGTVIVDSVQNDKLKFKAEDGQTWLIWVEIVKTARTLKIL